jgi:hypothetical protein
MRILRFFLFCLAFSSMATGVFLLGHSVLFERYVSLKEVQGISQQTLEKAGVTFIITQPIPQVARGFYAFEVTLLSPQLSGQKIAFYGGGQDLNEMTAAVDFVEKASAVDVAEEALEGFVQRSMNTIWDLGATVWEAVTTPSQFVGKVGNAATALAGYLSDVAGGATNPAKDALRFLRRVQQEEAATVAAEAGFTFETCPIPQAKSLAIKLARAKLLGKLSSDMALAIGSGCAASSAIKALRRTTICAAEVGESASLFARILRPARSAELAQRARVSLGDPALLQVRDPLRIAGETIKHQSDPVKLATLGIRGGNPRLNRILAAMHHVEQAGADLLDFLRRWLPDEIHPDFYYSRPMTVDRLMANYTDAKAWRLFENEANLQSLARGRSATILDGPYAGQKTHVDHIIPVSRAPELNANMANLRILPESVNVARSNVLDRDALHAAQLFQEIGWTPDEALTAAVSLGK